MYAMEPIRAVYGDIITLNLTNGRLKTLYCKHCCRLPFGRRALTEVVCHEDVLLEGVLSTHGDERLELAHCCEPVRSSSRFTPCHFLVENVEQGNDVSETASCFRILAKLMAGYPISSTITLGHLRG